MMFHMSGGHRRLGSQAASVCAGSTTGPGFVLHKCFFGSTSSEGGARLELCWDCIRFAFGAVGCAVEQIENLRLVRNKHSQPEGQSRGCGQCCHRGQTHRIDVHLDMPESCESCMQELLPALPMESRRSLLEHQITAPSPSACKEVSRALP